MNHSIKIHNQAQIINNQRDYDGLSELSNVPFIVQHKNKQVLKTETYKIQDSFPMTTNQTTTTTRVNLRLDLFKNQLRHNLISMPEFGSYIAELQKEIREKERKLVTERVNPQRGRGGNSMAENVKKTFLSLLPKFVPQALFVRFKQECIKKYDLRSQKQNIFVFFLYLKHLCLQGEIDQTVLRNLKAAIDSKINKYILNSRSKMEIEPERRQFHLKNITEFQKFLTINVSFQEGSTFRELVSQLSILFLRKKVSCRQAESKLRRVIRDLPALNNFFSDFEASEDEFTPSNTHSVKMEEDVPVKQQEPEEGTDVVKEQAW